jgi:hypothetical protein
MKKPFNQALVYEVSGVLDIVEYDSSNNISMVVNDIRDYHLTPAEPGLIARDAWIPFLRITYVLPLDNSLKVNPFFEDTREIYDYEIQMVKDVTRAKKPIDSDRIIYGWFVLGAAW